MDQFKTLVIMQLKEKIDLSFLKSKKQLLFKVIFALLGFVAITALAYVVLYIFQRLNIFSAINHLPLSLMSVIFLIMFLFSLFTCMVGLSKTLYYAKDNQIFLTYPVNSSTLFLSKLVVYYINEVKRSFTFVVPIFFAYGMLSGLPAYYYLWLIVMITIYTLIPVLIGALLSLPVNFIMRFLNRYPVIKYILLLAILALIITMVVFALTAIPEDINLIQGWRSISQAIREFLAWFSDKFFIFYAFIIFLCGQYENLRVNFFTEYPYIVLLVMLAVIAVLVLLNFLISRPLYLKMASRQFEFDKNFRKKSKPNYNYNGFFSSCLYESKKSIRNPSVLTVTTATAIIAPIAILLLNTIYSAINTRLMGDYLTISFNILVILLFILAHNISVSYIFSRDGRANVLNKTKPKKPLQILLPYLFYNFVTSTLILIVTSSIFLSSSRLGANGILIFFILWFIMLAHLLWSAEFDFLHPKGDKYALEGSATVNSNEVKSTILAFALSLIFFGLVLFFLMDGLGGVWIKLFVLSLAFLLLRIYLFYYKTKVLYKEV
mgnify:FL=1